MPEPVEDIALWQAPLMLYLLEPLIPPVVSAVISPKHIVQPPITLPIINHQFGRYEIDFSDVPAGHYQLQIGPLSESVRMRADRHIDERTCCSFVTSAARPGCKPSITRVEVVATQSCHSRVLAQSTLDAAVTPNCAPILPPIMRQPLSLCEPVLNGHSFADYVVGANTVDQCHQAYLAGYFAYQQIIDTPCEQLLANNEINASTLNSLC